MIVESLIQDESKLTLDCAKATLHKGSKAEIEDALYWTPEVQGAIKLGMLRVVGKTPDPLPVEAGKPEEKFKYKNVHTTKVCLECIKDYADPGGIISIPESKIPEREVQNAIAWGMLERVDGPKDEIKPRLNVPVVIDEFTSSDAVDSEAKDVLTDLPPVEEKPLSEDEKAIVASRSRKPKKEKAPKEEFKPKAISSSAELDDSDDGFYSETKVVDPETKHAKKAAPQASVLVEGDEPEGSVEDQPATGMPRRTKSFGFMDVFGGAQVSEKKPEAKATSGEEDTF